MMAYSDDVRGAFESLLGPIPDQVWSLAVKYLEFDLDLGEPIETVVEQYLDEVVGFLPAYEMDLGDGSTADTIAAKRRRKKPPADGWSREHQQQVLKKLYADDARADASVKAFRRELKVAVSSDPKWVGNWIDHQRNEEGLPPERFKDVVPSRNKILDISDSDPIEIAVRDRAQSPTLDRPFTSYARLTFADLPSNEIRQLAVRKGGVLDRLGRMSDDLEKSYRWRRGSGVAFVLMRDFDPDVSASSVDYDSRYPRTSWNRIRLDLDPTLTPAEVSEIYSSIRQRVVKGRYRRLSEKRLVLVEFCHDRDWPDQWPELMAAWNYEHPNWHHSDVNNFKRDATRAREHLLRPRFWSSLDIAFGVEGKPC